MGRADASGADRALVTETFLAHYGVKGMRWGIRKKTDVSSKPKRLSRKEIRQINREGRKKFYEDKANRILSEASKKGDDVLIKIVTPGSTYPTVVTGKEFTNYLAKGGAFDIKMSDVYATNRGNGGYELNASPNPRYQKIKR